MTAFGLMLHHFFDDRHPMIQGALSADQFDRMLDFLSRQHRIVDPDEWCEGTARGTLADDALCITFDDSLRCQFDIAFPVLRDRGLKAFWFVYTSPLDGVPEKLELYRYFRNTAFDSVDAFYDAFLAQLETSEWAGEVARARDGFDPGAYLQAFPMYTDGDRLFRFLRDKVLGGVRYDAVMARMIEAAGLDGRAVQDLLWMDERCLRELVGAGHEIGLHSHTHPLNMAELPLETQRQEFSLNRARLQAMCGCHPRSMSHPSNSYDDKTLALLSEMGIGAGFRANMETVPYHPLTVPREDHANVARSMSQCG